MSRDDKLELVGDFWNSLSSGQRLSFGGIVFVLVVAVVGVTHTVDQKINENKLTSVEAKNEGAILQLKREGARSADPSFSIGIRVTIPGEENVPKLSEAESSDLSMSDFASLSTHNGEEHLKKTNHLTTLQKPLYNDSYKNKSYTWSGYVSDVHQVSVSGDVPEYCVVIRLDRDRKDGFSAACVFSGNTYSEMMKALFKDQLITVRGVRAESGRLLDCRIVRAEAPAGTNSGR